ncbi:MAG: hypothetical protein NTZ78_01695, partial [Candidatus Aureabacteria bacterium]|nr:hypothetical protein [Candidatus Auribacterota bacterium]
CCSGTAWCFHRRLRRRNVAGFNRRMPKTARPVVWEGLRAKSRSPDPIFEAYRARFPLPRE